MVTLVGVGDIANVQSEGAHVEYDVGEILKGIIGFLPIPYLDKVMKVSDAVDLAEATTGTWADPKQFEYVWTAEMAIWEMGTPGRPEVVSVVSNVVLGIDIERVKPIDGLEASPGSSNLALVPSLGLTFAAGWIQSGTADWATNWMTA